MIVTYPASGLLPIGAHFQNEQDDQGHDFATYRKKINDGLIQAPGSGHCTRVGSDRPFPDGFGPDYPYVWIATGPYAGPDGHGREWYIGHCTTQLRVGQQFSFGQPLALANQGINFRGTTGGWCEFGQAFNSAPGPKLSWHWYDHLILTPLNVVVPDPVLRYGDTGPLVDALTSNLAVCGYLPGRRDKFDRAVHGAVVAFKTHHHIPMPTTSSKKDRGIVDQTVTVALQHAAHWCRQHHKTEV